MEESNCKKGKWGISGKKAKNRSHQEYQGVLSAKRLRLGTDPAAEARPGEKGGKGAFLKTL